MPKIKEQIKNVALSLADAAAYALQNGKIKAADHEIEKRIKTCQACQHLDANRCSVCGCFISLKTGIASERCPIKKW